MKADIVLGVIAGLMHIVAYVIYNWQMLRGVSKPNAATWILWAIFSFFNCLSYIIMTGDWVKGIPSISSTAFCAVVLLISVVKGKMFRLSQWDKLALVTGILALVVWLFFRSAVCANMILQVGVLISFIPTMRGVWCNPTNEQKALPWFVWSSAYITNIVVICLRWQWQPLDLVYPINGIILHSVVGFLAIRKNQK